ncbi:MAG: hypothetical protein R6U40_02660, partial [Desulfobacterales bacterium]
FEELLPHASIIRHRLESQATDRELIDLVVDIFEALNHRIHFIYDRDHQLGHSYFLNIHSFEELRNVFTDRVIPLLQEYFYGAWDKICTVLGCPYSEDGKPERHNSLVKEGKYIAPIITADVFAEEATIGFDHSDYEDRLNFQVNSNFARRANSKESLFPFFMGILPDEKSSQYEKSE